MPLPVLHLLHGSIPKGLDHTAIDLARARGWKEIGEYSSLKAGDKAYVVTGGKSAAFFIIGRRPIVEGVNYITSHVDSPRLDLKMKPLYEKEGVTYLDTHYYGGIKKYQWVTLPLAIHGVVFKKDGSRIDITLGEDEDGPSFCISDILPHIAQEQRTKTASAFIDG